MKLHKTFVLGLLISATTTSFAHSKAAETDVYKFTPIEINCHEDDSLATKQDAPLLPAEVMPSFPGGRQTLMKYIACHVKYPAKAQKEGIHGRVVVQFIVERDGSISNPKIVRSIHPMLDEEAIRVVKNMPNWNPGIINGKPVRVRYYIPINFNLNKDK